MARKLALGMLAVIGVVAMAGVGFAAYTASATTTVNASAGSFYLAESAVVGAQSLTSASGGCTFSGSGNTWTLYATNLLPGDYCNWTVTVSDPGSIGGAPPAGYISGCSGTCSQLTAAAFWYGPYGPLAPLSGNVDTFHAVVSDVGSGQVTESDSWTL
ncbi:MAG TPA: hypothetical protein VEH10_00055, partial [Thermoplasmata archaeon]|nr:hypothetical protein [Thermoplasmata archaeon]